MLIIAAFIMSLLAVNESNSEEIILYKITSCQHALTLCATGKCQPEHVTKVCPVQALKPKELMILQTELNSAANKINGFPETVRNLCAEEFESYYAASRRQLKRDGKVFQYHLKDLQQDFHGPDLEVFYRAGLESNLTGITAKAANIEGARDVKFNNCPLSPVIPDMLLRAQNLAFAREHDFIGRMRKREVDQRLLRPYFHTFLHADLWQQAQKEALPVFESLQVQGKYPAGPVNNFHRRVGAHVPLYDDDKLAREWPR